MSCQKYPGVSRGDVGMRDPPGLEQRIKGTAILHQQRRLKQATQFVHKDSADLLPLDQLRRLGTTSKDLQPHSVIQRRLLGSSLDKEPNSLAQPSDLEDEGKQLQHQTNKEIVSPHLCDNRSDPPHLCDEGSQIICLNDERPKPSHPCEETLGGWKENILLIPCKVCTQDVRAKLSIEHQQNFISRSFAERLGFGISLEKGNPEELNVDIELGTERLKGKAVLMDDGITEFILGLSALVTLKSRIDLDKGVLKTPSQEISFLSPLKRECISART